MTKSANLSFTKAGTGGPARASLGTGHLDKFARDHLPQLNCVRNSSSRGRN